MPYAPQPLYLFDTAWPAPEIERLLDDAFASWLARSVPSDDQTLFHYTDLAGLRGILASRSFWLTHAFALNDPSELGYGVALVDREIHDVLAAHVPDTPAHQALTVLRTSVQNAFGLLHHAFLTSFCEDGDLLSQWREYGARGGGYAVGIRVSDQTHLGVPDTDYENPNPYFRKVLYDPAEQQRLVRTFLDAYVIAVANAMQGSARGLHPEERPVAPVWMASHAANYFFDLAVSFKHPAFEEEQEWRLIRVLVDHADADQLCFREARGELVPYRPGLLYSLAHEASPAQEETMPVDRARTFSLREIRFGPTLNARATSAALSLLVAHEATRSHPVTLARDVRVIGAAAALR